MSRKFEIDLETQDRRIEFARMADVNPSDVQAVRLELNTLRQNGLLIDLNVTGLSMLGRSATWLELGVLDQKVKDRFTKGRKSYFPDAEKKLKSVETRGRYLLEKYTYSNIPGISPWRWMPWTAYKAFRKEFTDLEYEFNDTLQDILSSYEYYLSLLVDDFSQVARSAWRSIIGQGYDAAEIDGIEYYGEASFTDAVVRYNLSRVPLKSQIENGLKIQYTTGVVYGAQDVEADRLQAERINIQITEERRLSQLRQQEEQTKLFALQREDAHNQMLQSMERDKKFAELEAIKQVEYDRAMAMLAEQGSPIIQVIGQLRERMADIAQGMLDSIRKNGFVRGKVAEQGKGLLQFFDLMAAHNDDELRRKLDDLRTAIGDNPQERKVEDVSIILDQIVDLADATASELSEVSRAAFIEI